MIDSHIDLKAPNIFPRLLRFYTTFNIISAFISSASLIMLTFNEFHPAISKQLLFASSLLVVSILSSVTSVTVSTILLFGFEGYKSATWSDIVLAWAPLITLDCSIFAFLGGLLLWCMDNKENWCISVFGSVAGILLLIICWASINTYLIVKRTGGLKEKKVT